MNDPLSALESAFLDDHQHMTRSLSQIKHALAVGEVQTARRLADQLDRQAGPHITFEEEVFYPALVETHGLQEVNKLFYEHHLGRELILRLLDPSAPAEIPPPQLKRLAEIAQGTLNHAESCGTLFSHIQALDPARQKKWLSRLESYRKLPLRWSERPDFNED